MSALCAQQMMFEDRSRIGLPFAKDPYVAYLDGKYFMYYTIPPSSDRKHNWGIGIATSKDLCNWTKVGELNAKDECDAKNFGICAPGGVMRGDTLHLFYQTYGLAKNDAICYAYTVDGINFTRNKSNPVFRPTGDWNCGRAIDADVVRFKDQYFLYFATRDPEFKLQLIGVAVADANTSFGRGEWKQVNMDAPILKPELKWEGECIEAPSLVERKGKLYMFYAGEYNNKPQQVGVAVSDDGINWTRCFDEPLVPCGAPGEWNSSESGHPCIYKTPKNKYYLFYQGNNDMGRTWKLTNLKVKFKKGLPTVNLGLN